MVHKSKASILRIDLADTTNVVAYSIENEDMRVVRDIDIFGRYVSILYDKNEVAVYDIITNKRVFRSLFRDATA